MASKYEKQIEKLVAYVKRLNQLVEERTQQLQYWQGYAHKLRDERSRLSSAMLATAKRVLTEISSRYTELRAENAKLRAHIQHLSEHQERSTFGLRNQLQYTLSRIDDLSLERKEWRKTMQAKQQQIWAAMSAKDEAERRLGDELKALRQQLASHDQQTRALTERLTTAEQQIAIQQEQWQDLLAQKEALAQRLRESENALSIAQRALSETLATQQSSMGREVDHLRALVISLQRQTESLHTEISHNQDTIEKQERFIALLKQDKPNIRSLGDRRKDSPPNPEEQASG